MNDRSMTKLLATPWEDVLARAALTGECAALVQAEHRSRDGDQAAGGRRVRDRGSQADGACAAEAGMRLVGLHVRSPHHAARPG